MTAIERGAPSGIIRSPSPSDLPGLSALLGELGYPASVLAVESRLSRLAGQANVAVFVAERNGASIGFATAHVLEVLHADDPVVMLTALVVAELHRGQGVGHSLVAAVESWAEKRGAPRVTVASGLARAGAHAFYEKLGYEHTARRYSKRLR